MKPSELHAVWSMPDNSRLTAKQYSFRLPVHVAAKLAALCELYPSKTRTQIVGDLLATAIEQAVEGLPSLKGRRLDHVRDDDEEELDIYEDVGPRGRFLSLSNQHYADLERELGNEEPALLYQHEYRREDPMSPVAAFAVTEVAKR